MKNNILTAFLMLFLLSVGTITAGIAKEETKTFKVYGNCGMCKNRIEKAVNKLDGIYSAEWNKKTGMITVKFDDEIVDEDGIHEAIAAVGHDTEKVKAEDETYNNLMGCCQYQRSE